MFGVDTVKSVILTLAASERVITVEEAVSLSRLEEEFQVMKLVAPPGNFRQLKLKMFFFSDL